MSRIAHTLNIIIVSITGTPIGFIMELEPGVMDLLRLPQPLTCLTRHARQPTTGKASLCLEISRDYHSCHCIAWSQIGGKPCSLQGTYGVAYTIGIPSTKDRFHNVTSIPSTMQQICGGWPIVLWFGVLCAQYGAIFPGSKYEVTYLYRYKVKPRGHSWVSNRLAVR